MKDYKDIWDNLSTNFDNAAFHVCCVSDEDEIRSNGQLTADFLKQVLQITPEDRVLEIGCGVARIGRELAPFCGEWHGADISGNMIEHAKERTQDVLNVFLHELPDSSLSIFPDGYFDCVYSSIVFMHLDKIDMFTYIRDAYRVLAPGGRAYFDTYNLLAPEAWQEFLKTLDEFPPDHRPGHVSQFSTPQEMRKFMEEAGFEEVHVDGENSPQLVLALGRKPGVLGAERPPFALSSLPGDKRERRTARLSQKQYIEHLEKTVALKNEHIDKMERLVRRQEKAIARLSATFSQRIRRALTRK
ncbi:MAG TPA: methyltransferase domain-containing protein [Chloroflexia bacterium]|nr:methyltransferase domain-containing protein [Chloroflexia bacterium]